SGANPNGAEIVDIDHSKKERSLSVTPLFKKTRDITGLSQFCGSRLDERGLHLASPFCRLCRLYTSFHRARIDLLLFSEGSIVVNLAHESVVQVVGKLRGNHFIDANDPREITTLHAHVLEAWNL